MTKIYLKSAVLASALFAITFADISEAQIEAIIRIILTVTV